MKICNKCGNQHIKSGNFCSRSCANSRSFTEEAKYKKSVAMKQFAATDEGQVNTQRRSMINGVTERSSISKDRTRTTIYKKMDRKFDDGLISDRKVLRRVLTERRGYKCDVCSLVDWCNAPLTLQVDHIDGDPSNNLPINLRLICPNCHSQTSSFGGRNKGKGRKARGLPLN